MAMPGKQVAVQLSDEEYALLEDAASRRDCSIADLIRQAIRQVCMRDLETDLNAQQVPGLAQKRLLVDEEEEEIGIGGPEILADREGPSSE
jgi:predicted DNA-binding ribbon-helix-helix protein